MATTLYSKEFIEQWRSLQHDRKANPEKYRLRSTGLKGLDKILEGGVEFGNLILYGGEQKIGKSVLLSHTAKTFGLAGDPFGYFSLEMTNNAVATRMICDMSGVEKSRIRRIEWSDSEWDRLDAEADKIEDFEAWWSYGIGSVPGIKDTLKNINVGLKDEEKVRTIFVDYVQLMKHSGKALRMEQLSEISHAFKRMSVELSEPMLIFLATQVNRESAKASIISANSFLGTGDFERDMDVGVIMHSVKDDDGKVMDDYRQLTVVGSRETGVDTVTIRFNGATSSVRDMEDVDSEITEDYWEQQSRRLSQTEDIP
jgi:replicative DNA helicase